MGIWTILQKTEQNLRKRIETALSPETTSLEGGFASPGVVSQSLFEIDFVEPDPCRSQDVPEISLLVLRGTAEPSGYRLKKERILIGRTPDVMDREGRIIRKNDVAFLDNGEDVNATVGYSHARIWWDFEEEGFFLMDESSRYGTCIVRQGRSLEVPEGSYCGIRIHAGDEIYCGQACLRFYYESMN
jgi:hypothetical protein